MISDRPSLRLNDWHHICTSYKRVQGRLTKYPADHLALACSHIATGVRGHLLVCSVGSVKCRLGMRAPGMYFADVTASQACERAGHRSLGVPHRGCSSWISHQVDAPSQNIDQHLRQRSRDSCQQHPAPLGHGSAGRLPARRHPCSGVTRHHFSRNMLMRLRQPLPLSVQ